MIPTKLLITIAVAALFSTAHAAIITVSTGSFVADYNPSNTISAVAPGSSSTQTDFATTVSAAYASGNGGVWNFNTPSDVVVLATVNDTWQINYGTNKALNIGQDVNMRYNNFSSAGATSVNTGDANWGDLFVGTSNPASFTLNFSLSGSGLAANEQIREIGFAVLNRSSGNTPLYSITATLDDNSTIVLTDTITVGAGNTDNTHFGIKTSGVRYITGLSVAADSGQIAIIDDLGFVTSVPVPEPSTYAVIASLVVLAISVRARRRK